VTAAREGYGSAMNAQPANLVRRTGRRLSGHVGAQLSAADHLNGPTLAPLTRPPPPPPRACPLGAIFYTDFYPNSDALAPLPPSCTAASAATRRNARLCLFYHSLSHPSAFLRTGPCGSKTGAAEPLGLRFRFELRDRERNAPSRIRSLQNMYSRLDSRRCCICIQPELWHIRTRICKFPPSRSLSSVSSVRDKGRLIFCRCSKKSALHAGVCTCMCSAPT
jgi:hypothetical protein